MEHADDGSFTGVSGLVNKVIDSTWDSLTAHSIDGTLSLSKEVHGHGPWAWALAVGGHSGRIPAGPWPCQRSSEP